MDNRKHIRQLDNKGVRPTAIRLLVLDALDRLQRAVSLTELETVLDTVDKSSIFRTLELFARHHIVHSIDDGSGSVKYEICEGETECTLSDMHTHFYCTECHRTYCLKSIHIPYVELPDGFVMESVNYMVKGLCKECSSRHKD